MTTDNPIFDEFELSGLAAILPPEVTRLIRDQQQIINNLVDRVASLESRLEGVEVQLEDLQTTTGRERAYDRQRISKLETHKPKTGPKSREQINELMNYLNDCPNRVMPLEGARLHLGVSKTRLSNLLASPEAENCFLLIKNPNDRRKRLIKLRPQI